MSCSHQTTHDVWVEEENWYTGEMEGRWEQRTEYHTVDLDTHRYQCTRCRQVMYYSGAARAYYEEGKDFAWAPGWDKK